jgi:ribosome-associated protein YbcJ (S4-like RNA binding protein)
MRTQLETILSLTDQVQAAIDSGEWQQAHALETERRTALEQLIEESGVGADGGTALAALEERNLRLIGLVEHHKRRVLREATTVNTGHAAAAAYAETVR